MIEVSGFPHCDVEFAGERLPERFLSISNAFTGLERWLL
jgi:hypothetical protein